jgi:hypothetical protein
MNAISEATLAGHKIDASRGTMRGDVSAQWASRPADQRFLSLTELRDKVDYWANHSRNEEFKVADIQAVERDGNLVFTHDEIGLFETNHYSFGAVAALAGAPANYLRDLPPQLAAKCINHGLASTDDEKAAYIMTNGVQRLRAVTGKKYGRIFDREVVDAVIAVAGNGTGDTRWKVPGVIDWSNSTYNPRVDITKDTTTLYASDRDVFMFLVDDMHPVEVGKLKNGEPDLLFRGFYVWNSEVGNRTFGVATMYLRGVCQNRCLWGVEDFSETTFRHTAGAPERFAKEAAPALLAYSEGASDRLILGVQKAKAAVVATTTEDRIAFYAKLGIGKRKADDLILTGIQEEGGPPETVWDFAQTITAAARDCSWQDDRLKMEALAGKLLDKVIA